MAKAAATIVRTAPSHYFLNVFWVRVRLASSLFTLGKRKKSAGTRSGNYNRCWISLICLAAIQFMTTAAV